LRYFIRLLVFISGIDLCQPKIARLFKTTLFAYKSLNGPEGFETEQEKGKLRKSSPSIRYYMKQLAYQYLIFITLSELSSGNPNIFDIPLLDNFHAVRPWAGVNAPSFSQSPHQGVIALFCCNPR